MPTRPKKVSLDTNAVNIANAVRNNNSVFYKDYVPPITDISGLRQIGKIIMDMPALQNEFLNALVNRIAMVRITSKLYDNPWSRFKKGIVDYGETIEEIYVDLCRVYEFDVDKAENELFKRSNPDVRSAFHTINFMKFYKITISRQMLYRAFLSAQGMDDLISKIMESVYTSANYDEFLTMKYLLACTILNGRIYPIEIPVVNVDNAKAIVTAVKANSNRLTFPSRDYNPAGVFQHTPKGEQNIIINSDFDALMDVNVLASAFNMSKAEFDGKRILVDSFGSLDKSRLDELFKDDKGYKPISDADLAKLDKIPMVVTDDNFWMIFDNLVEMRDVENGQGLYWNYFYHLWKTFSVSPFSNAVMYVPAKPTVVSVEVVPATATIHAGGNLALTTTVEVTGFAPQTVIYESNNDNVFVTNGGVVTANENATGTATITVKSTFDETKTDTMTVTIN